MEEAQAQVVPQEHLVAQEQVLAWFTVVQVVHWHLEPQELLEQEQEEAIVFVIVVDDDREREEIIEME